MATKTKKATSTKSSRASKAKSIKAKKAKASKAEAKSKNPRATSQNGLTLAMNLFLHVLPAASDKVGMLKGDMQKALVKVGYRTTNSNPKVIIGQALYGLMNEGQAEKVSHGYWRLTKAASKERSKARKRESDKRRRAARKKA